MKQLRKIIFDMDGVITSEMRHWDSARLVVWEVLSDSRYLGLKDYFFPQASFPTAFHAHRERIIPQAFIAELKDRAVNSNWDISFIALSLYITHLVASMERDEREPLRDALTDGAGGELLRKLGQAFGERGQQPAASDGILYSFFSAVGDAWGHQVPEGLGDYFRQRTGLSSNLFVHRGTFWRFCQSRFQSWYTGSKLKENPELFIPGGERDDAIPTEDMYPIGQEQTIIPLDGVRETLTLLKGMGYSLCIATGRPKAEALAPLNRLELRHFFDEECISTADEVLEGERVLKEAGLRVRLTKPHPYCVLRALYPNEDPRELYSLSQAGNEADGMMVGDAVSDIDAGRGAGCLTVGVLTGAGSDAGLRERRAAAFLKAGAHHVIDSIAQLPSLIGQIKGEKR